jgi:hypothetical protein
LQQPSNLTPSPLEAEYEAALHYGRIPDPTFQIPPELNWFELPRAARASMVVYLRVSKLGAAISQYDSAEREKAKARANKKR